MDIVGLIIGIIGILCGVFLYFKGSRQTREMKQDIIMLINQRERENAIKSKLDDVSKELTSNGTDWEHLRNKLGELQAKKEELKNKYLKGSKSKPEDIKEIEQAVKQKFGIDIDIPPDDRDPGWWLYG